jgi:hypothetical protein
MPNLYFSNLTEPAKDLAKKAKSGVITRIHQGIYTDAKPSELEGLLVSKWHEVVKYLQPDAIASYRTAQELRPEEGLVVVTSNIKQQRKVHVAKVLTIDIQAGSTNELTEPFLPTMHRSAPPRMYLENLTSGRGVISKSLGQEWVEERLSIALRMTDGEKELNSIRDTAREFANANGLEKEFTKLSKIISALLSTHPVEGTLKNSVAIATAKREPYDVVRVERFQSLADYLNRCLLPDVPYTYTKSGWRHLSFFESYFSNFIEGTEFEIDEAEEIVFLRKQINNRHQDSHDVYAVFQQVSDYQAMSIFPETAEEFIKELQRRHFDMMLERKNKNPGAFKSKVNKAGTSVFVMPEDVIGTLTKGFEVYKTVKAGLEAAIFMQFLVSECHPFDDGNGRLSRVMMNSVLHSNDQYKLIVPTVHRDSYLNGLRKATRENKFATLVKVFYQLQKYTASIDWVDYGETRDSLESNGAQLQPDEGTPTFNKVIRGFKFDLPPELN